MYLLTEEPEFAGDVKKSAEANPEYCDVWDLKYSPLEFVMNSGMGKDRDRDPKIGREWGLGGRGDVSTAKSVTTYAPSLVIEQS
jgi:hypothetical protein